MLDYDLRYLQAGIESLEEYLLADDLYWVLRVVQKPGEPRFPSLTISGLLLAQSRINAYQLSYEQKLYRERVNGEMDRIMTRWRTAWENKAAHEYLARLNLWRNYLEDYREQPENHAYRYTYEVSRRVMLDLLQPFVFGRVEAEKHLLHGLDATLQSVFIPGEFIWDEELKAAFPIATFWYLYGTLR